MTKIIQKGDLFKLYIFSPHLISKFTRLLDRDIILSSNKI